MVFLKFPNLLLLSALLVSGAVIAKNATVSGCSVNSHSCHTLNVLLKDIPQEFPILRQVLSDAEKYQLQIIYTPVSQSGNNVLLQEFRFRVNDDHYFYPASTVKLVLSALALEWLYEQNIPELDRNSIMLTDASRPEQTTAYIDTTAENGLPSVAQYIKKILLVSDNDGYNRLYELLGPDYINQKLKNKGLNGTILNHRLSVPFTDDQNRHVNPVRFVDTAGRLLVSVAARHSDTWYQNSKLPTLGKGYYSGGKLINQPMDFSLKNKHTLPDLDGVVKRIVFPALFPENQRFNITAEDRDFMLDYMSRLPSESHFPAYAPEKYPDTYAKQLMFGGSKGQQLPHIRIYNKIGGAYGHALDAAYIVDLQNGVSFFLSVIIYVNENEILNDDTYQYEEIADPFMQQLGIYLHQWQLTQPR